MAVQQAHAADQLDRGDFGVQKRPNVISFFRRGTFQLAADGQPVSPPGNLPFAPTLFVLSRHTQVLVHLSIIKVSFIFCLFLIIHGDTLIKRSPSRILFVLPDIALASMATSFLVIMLTGCFYGLLEQYIIAIIYFLLAALIVSGSTAILAGGAALFLARYSPLYQLLTALLIGLLHGYLYSLAAHRVFALLLSTFNVPVLVPWMVGSSLGIAVGLTRSAVETDTLLTVERSDIVIVSGFLALLASCSLISACLLIAVQLLTGGVIQDRVINPTGTVTALVIRDDCGATCGCEMRVDLQASDHYVAEVYRSWTACDAQASWQSATKLYIRDDDGRSTLIDIGALGFTP